MDKVYQLKMLMNTRFNVKSTLPVILLPTDAPYNKLVDILLDVNVAFLFPFSSKNYVYFLALVFIDWALIRMSLVLLLKGFLPFSP